MEKRNIIWTDKEREAPHTVSIGMDPVMELPDDKTQRAGFYHERAGELIASDSGWKEFKDMKAPKEASDG